MLGQLVQKRSKKILFIVVILSAFLLFGAGCSLTQTNNSQSGKDLKEITFPISWLHGPQYAYTYIAKEKGYFKEQGLKVNIVENKGSAITSKLIANNEYPIGMVSAEVAMISRSKGMPLTPVAVADKVNPSGVTCYKSANVDEPKDLEGKKVGVTTNSNAYQQYIAFLRKTNVDRGKIEEIPISGSGKEWLAGKVDCHALYPFISEALAKTKGKKVNSLVYYDYGLKMYGQTIVANSDAIKEKPKLVRKVTQALVKALKFERENPDKALKIAFKQNPQIKSKKEYHTEVFRGRMALDKKLETPEKAGNGLMKRGVWKKTREIQNSLDLLKGKVNLDKFYTNRFIK